jgi:hypothetical protein
MRARLFAAMLGLPTNPRKGAAQMNTYVIRRKQAWRSVEEVQQVAARSKQIADDDFPHDVRWIRSYVIAEEDGSLGSVCM